MMRVEFFAAPVSRRLNGQHRNSEPFMQLLRLSVLVCLLASPLVSLANDSVPAQPSCPNCTPVSPPSPPAKLPSPPPKLPPPPPKLPPPTPKLPPPTP